MDQNEPLLAAAWYFWSNALNAFLFGHGPMKPTLADVLVLTSLNVSELDNFFSLSGKLEAGKDTLTCILRMKEALIPKNTQPSSICGLNTLFFVEKWLV